MNNAVSSPLRVKGTP